MDEADPAGSTSIYLIAEIAMSGGNLPVASAILFFLEVSMKDSRIPETVLRAISEGTHIIRAYREHLGYSIDELAVACGLAAKEIKNIESGLRYNKGYRDRIARSLSLPVGIFETESDISDAA